MRSPLAICLLTFIALGTQSTGAADPAEGKKLHDANCTECHGASIYTRPDRKVKSLAALQERVTSCTHMAQAPLSAEEQKSVVEYLNQQFYKFK